MTTGPLRILIVDDEAPARARLRDLLSDVAGQLPLEVVGEAGTARDAADVLSNHPADVVLLDIRMPEMDGIEFAGHLQKLPDPPAIVFTTAYDAYAIRAFEVHAIDYLLKPIRAGRLQDALTRAHSARRPSADAPRDLSKGEPAFLSAQERGRIHLIPVNEVLYLKAELKYVTVRTAEREFLLEDSLSRLEAEHPERFIRLHRNCLVARSAIRGFERAGGEGEAHWVALIEGCDERLAVSRRQHHIVRELSRS